MSTDPFRFPKQEDFTPPPPMSETTFEKMERISAAIKVALLLWELEFF